MTKNLKSLCKLTGTAVTKNLLRNGFNVSAIMDVKPDLCQGYPDTVKVCLKGLCARDIQILLRFV